MTSSLSRPEPGAGHPFLTFLNTVTDDRKTRQENSFADASELCTLLEAAGFQQPLRASDPAEIGRLVALRETAHSVLSAIAAGRVAGSEDSRRLTEALRTTYQGADFAIGSAGLCVKPAPELALFDQLVLSLDDLIRSEDFARLRECRRCTHLFLDKGRGVGRRWCSMARCGNRAKAESFRARQKDAA